MKTKAIVIGGSGFIGSAIQQWVIEGRVQDSFVFGYNAHPERINGNLEKVRINLVEKDSTRLIKDYPVAIYVSGNADHGVAMNSPALDLEMTVRTFLSFMKSFKGSLVLLSSQATYYGLEGEISESVDHVPPIPYGLSKQMVEAYSKYFLKPGYLSRLWIFKLMYAFGRGEKERRLIPRCARATRTDETVAIYGGGKSFLNPLPSWFIAEILLKAAESLEKKEENFTEVTNINHPERVTVKDVIVFLENLKHFNYVIKDSGEEWPVKFWGNTNKLSGYMREWSIDFPNVWDSLKKYFVELVSGM
jgi:nucleoside-diphosphate-sugar epimerase